MSLSLLLHNLPPLPPYHPPQPNIHFSPAPTLQRSPSVLATMASKHQLKPVASSSKLTSDAFVSTPAHGSDSRASQRKRAELVTRIEKIREHNLKRREEIYTKAWQELNERQNALMSNPPTEINYLVRLHRESVKREQELVAVRVYHDHLLSAARAAFEAEVRAIEEEFSSARTQAREKLLESLEERRRKLKDEKELIDFTEETVGHSHRAHATRGLRTRAARAVFSRASPVYQPGEPAIDLDDGPPLPAAFATADDPLAMATLNVNPHLRQSPIFQQLLHLGSQHHPSRRGGAGRRAPTGLPGPISLSAITPGAWNNFHKSQLGISPAKTDDADADLEEIRKITGIGSKKRRNGGPVSNQSNNPSGKKKSRED